MASLRGILVFATVTVCVGFQQHVPEGPTSAEESPHALAGLCLDGSGSGPSAADCDAVCTLCHAGSTQPGGFYEVGDASICGACHAEKTTDTRGAENLLASAEHGNHPVAVPYQATKIRSTLAARPAGPKLFRDADGERPRMYCSTCHDPHGTERRLLRVQGGICRTCHVM